MSFDDEQTWVSDDPNRLIARGHPAGEVLEAWKWLVVDRQPGFLVVEAGLPDSLKNPLGQLFGGFTPSYVDFVSIFTLQSLEPDHDPTSPRHWVTTINMRCDYFEPITGPRFRMRSEVINQRGKTALVGVTFEQDAATAAYAITTLRTVPQIG